MGKVSRRRGRPRTSRAHIPITSVSSHMSLHCRTSSRAASPRLLLPHSSSRALWAAPPARGHSDSWQPGHDDQCQRQKQNQPHRLLSPGSAAGASRTFSQGCRKSPTEARAGRRPRSHTEDGQRVSPHRARERRSADEPAVYGPEQNGPLASHLPTHRRPLRPARVALTLANPFRIGRL